MLTHSTLILPLSRHGGSVGAAANNHNHRLPRIRLRYATLLEKHAIVLWKILQPLSILCRYDGYEITETMEEVIHPSMLFTKELRANIFGWAPEERHALVQSVPISLSIPEEIQRLLVTAKNLIIYACFHYPFNVIAMQTAFSALELAIRKRAEVEGITKKITGLHSAMELALEHHWIPVHDRTRNDQSDQYRAG